MDFPQQIEETLAERQPTAYDVVMESPLFAAKSMESKLSTTPGSLKRVDLNTSISAANVNNADKMSASIQSGTLDDTTPSDSGVQMLDSESSELMIDSITSQTGFEFEDAKCITIAIEKTKSSSIVGAPEEAAVVDSNFNVTAISAVSAGVEEAMTTSQISTFGDTTENIVYRRKVRKTPAVAKAPKKRVSFHEDILKNTRTDNIHIEHGFITYKAGIRKMNQQVSGAGRYSWCSEGDKTEPTELPQNGDEDTQGGDAANGRRRIVYRNACSDVLDYGNSDVYDMNDDNCLQYDNSGVFEYTTATDNNVAKLATALNAKKNLNPELYKCSCSSSNSSLDSDENDKNSNCHQYEQAKSSSCDCIGVSNNNNNFIGENCYYSEPNIGSNNSPPRQKSVWNKEKKPKSSCLKKTKFHTDVIQEQDLSNKVKKFNVHDVNQLLDNSSKMIFGSLKSIFTMPLPERGVPEGSEDLQAVIECVPEPEQTPEHQKNEFNAKQIPDSPPLKTKPFLSKSLDGSKQQQPVKKFVHNVDEQLRRRNEEEMYAPTRDNSSESQLKETEHSNTPQLKRQNEFDNDNDNDMSSLVTDSLAAVEPDNTPFRNKFIINCESTVFEHTGVSYSYESSSSSFNDLICMEDSCGNIADLIEKDTPFVQPEPDQLRNAFMSAPIAKTFSNFFRSFKDTGKDKSSAKGIKPNNRETEAKHKIQDQEAKEWQEATDNYFALKMPRKWETNAQSLSTSTPYKVPKISSTISDISSIMDNTSSTNMAQLVQQTTKSNSSLTSGIASGSVSTSGSCNQRESLAIGCDLRVNLEKQSRHIPSPLKKRLSASGSNLIQQNAPQRYGVSAPQPDPTLLSPDLFSHYNIARGGSGRDSKSTILSEEFDDILTVTTDTDKNESDIIIVDYPEVSDRQSSADYANLLKPPQPPAKTSLINRFLRNVTQKKILESSIKRNNFFAHKLKTGQKLFTGNLYVKGARPRNIELIEDLNAEIAMEIEMSGVNSPRRELTNLESDLPGDLSRFELGIGEISVDVFIGSNLNFLLNASEMLMKAFKLYTGYSKEGYMTPVLVFLTDKTLYVTDLVRNRLCSKFILAYKDLDVILTGPYGNTVLLSNSTRDMQQVLLAGGPYSADSLVANLELCARRHGSILPAVGQLTLNHLVPLQDFVRANSCVGKSDSWMYYAVVNMPGSSLGEGGEQEPLGPHAKGFLMHRRTRDHISTSKHQLWNPGYFLLKAGVLYMFNDSTQKIPSWAMALAECQGARRAVKAGRPHCFEIMLKDKMLLQLAAPDEYVASEWLQALLQSASGLFEMQEKHKTLGCTLVVTQNHLITLREDFSAPLKQFNKKIESIAHEGIMNSAAAITNTKFEEELPHFMPDTGSLLSSAMSTPTRGTLRSCSSINSTPTKLSQFSRSTTTYNTTLGSSLASNATTNSTISTATFSKQAQVETKEGQISMNSVYGKNSGLEILTCADIKEMIGIKIPSHNDTWWCVLEFSCQEVRECSDDLVIFFASSAEMQRFLRLLEQLWQAKNNDLFPITVLDEDDLVAEQCTTLYMEINRSWEPLLSAALGYPL
ncbi:pleckstrin homology domain-containing protein pruning defect 1 isoform 1-T1 [Glossina fuscipes fuscipes]